MTDRRRNDEPDLEEWVDEQIGSLGRDGQWELDVKQARERFRKRTTVRTHWGGLALASVVVASAAVVVLALPWKAMLSRASEGESPGSLEEIRVIEQVDVEVETPQEAKTAAWVGLEGAEGTFIRQEADVRQDIEPQETNEATETERFRPPGSVFRIGAGVTAPRVISQVQPEYPEEARKEGVEGRVILECIVDVDGSIEVVRVVRSLGPALDREAVDALEQWEFQPGMRDGEPVRVALNVEVNFTLR